MAGLIESLHLALSVVGLGAALKVCEHAWFAILDEFGANAATSAERGTGGANFQFSRWRSGR